MSLSDQLDQLSALRVTTTNLPQQRIDALMRLIPPANQEQARTILQEYDDLEAHTKDQIQQLESAIKEHVLHTGEIVKGTYLQVLMMAPRVTWDNKAMGVYATLHPEVLAYRKVGEPSVQIRARSLQRS